MKFSNKISSCTILFLWMAFANAQTIEYRLTKPDRSALFAKQQPLIFSSTSHNNLPTITLDASKKYQSIDGFGFALTGGSAYHLMQMTPQTRTKLLHELFACNDSNIGISYLRISIGASDLNDHTYSYDDLPNGLTDWSLDKFDLGTDKKELIPVLKEILSINPHIKILASPWSAPTWMKTNNDFRGGSLKSDCFNVYAQYFVRYIQAMKKQGIRIDAITVQNEPLHPGNNPSMYMTAADQCMFIKKHLGPAFQEVKIATKIIIYDHNANRPDYPISILNDKTARQYIDGSAFHLYEGSIDTLSEVHRLHPDKNLYFTELWMGAPGNFGQDMSFHINQLIIGAVRNWCRNVIEWNLTSNPQLEPHTDQGGCDRCLGGITIDGDKVTRNAGYYIIAHASKFVRPGSTRIKSTLPANKSLNNIAFITPKGERVLIVINNNDKQIDFCIKENGKTVHTFLPSGTVGTYVWK